MAGDGGGLDGLEGLDGVGLPLTRISLAGTVWIGRMVAIGDGQGRTA
jgi:hypothetical protein